jgi:hypothetical protein
LRHSQLGQIVLNASGGCTQSNALGERRVYVNGSLSNTKRPVGYRDSHSSMAPTALGDNGVQRRGRLFADNEVVWSRQELSRERTFRPSLGLRPDGWQLYAFELVRLARAAVT